MSEFTGKFVEKAIDYALNIVAAGQYDAMLRVKRRWVKRYIGSSVARRIRANKPHIKIDSLLVSWLDSHPNAPVEGTIAPENVAKRWASEFSLAAGLGGSQLTPFEAAIVISSFLEFVDEKMMGEVPGYKDKKDQRRFNYVLKELESRPRVDDYIENTLGEIPAYLTAADQEIQALQGVEFEESLIKNILFQNTLLIPDIFFFFTRQLVNHVKARSTRSLLEIALERGWVRPSFRNRQWKSFEDCIRGFKEIKKKDLVDDGPEIARRLDASFLSGARNLAYWPDYVVAERYYDKVSSLLKDGSPAHALISPGSKAEHHWNLSRDWRTKAPTEGCSLNGPDERGLARMYLLTAVVRQIVPSHKEIVTTFASAEKIIVESEPAKLDAFRSYWLWVTEIYEYNQATCLDAVAQCPSYHPERHLIATSCVSHNGKTPTASTLQFRVPFVRLDVIRTLPGDTLSEVRDIGFGYRMALRNWFESPDSTARQSELERMLVSYADETVKWAKINEAYEKAELQISLDSQPRPLLYGPDGVIISKEKRFEGYEIITDVEITRPLGATQLPDLTFE